MQSLLLTHAPGIALQPGVWTGSNKKQQYFQHFRNPPNTQPFIMHNSNPHICQSQHIHVTQVEIIALSSQVEKTACCQARPCLTHADFHMHISNNMPGTSNTAWDLPASYINEHEMGYLNAPECNAIIAHVQYIHIGSRNSQPQARRKRLILADQQVAFLLQARLTKSLVCNRWIS